MAALVLQEGDTASASMVVTENDTALALAVMTEDDFPEVLATSRMIAVMELAAAVPPMPAQLR
mgnify:CR=1 FL=1